VRRQLRFRHEVNVRDRIDKATAVKAILLERLYLCNPGMLTLTLRTDAAAKEQLLAMVKFRL